jgi:hypothetical protein
MFNFKTSLTNSTRFLIDQFTPEWGDHIASEWGGQFASE